MPRFCASGRWVLTGSPVTFTINAQDAPSAIDRLARLGISAVSIRPVEERDQPRADAPGYGALADTNVLPKYSNAPAEDTRYGRGPPTLYG